MALATGTWDVFGMLGKISPEQLDEWIAYDILHPIGLTATELAEIEYRPDFQTQSPAEQRAILGSIAAATNR